MTVLDLCSACQSSTLQQSNEAKKSLSEKFSEFLPSSGPDSDVGIPDRASNSESSSTCGLEEKEVVNQHFAVASTFFYYSSGTDSHDSDADIIGFEETEEENEELE